MLKVYGDAISGNCYKIKLALTQLGRPFEWIPIDVTKREARTPEFLAKNPNGKVPLLEIEPGTYLAESNAILCYLGEDTPLLPPSGLDRAYVMQWLFYEQYSHEPYIATSRYLRHILKKPEAYRSELEANEGPGYAALDLMEKILERQRWFAVDRYTIADIALFAYTHVADEGGFDLGRYPAIRAWFKRVEATPDFVPMS